MKKLWSIFKISFEQEFAYRLNFILWRVRNVFQVLLTYFLWSTVFTNPNTQIFGYDIGKLAVVIRTKGAKHHKAFIIILGNLAIRNFSFQPRNDPVR